MRKSSFICNSKTYPTACLLVAAFVFIGVFYLLLLPSKTQDRIISQVHQGRGAFYVTNRIQELKDNKENFSRCVFILGDSTIQNFEQELSEDNAAASLRNNSGIKFICLYRQAFTLVDYFFIANAIMPLKPKAIIVCINMATFSPIYQNNPSYKFPEMISLCRPDLLESNIDTFSRFYGLPSKDIMGYVKNRSENRFYMLLMGTRKIIRDWITENIEKKILGRRTTEEMSNSGKQVSLFLTTYNPDRSSITDDHPYFVLAKAMNDLCKAEDQKLFFYITPFDVEFVKREGVYGEIGPAVEYIKNRFSKALGGDRGIVYDFHDKLSEYDIVDTPGHLKRSGREKVYRFLAEIPSLNEPSQK